MPAPPSPSTVAAAASTAAAATCLPVVVIGAGPTGLAAAARLAERGMPAVVLEAGSGPAAAVASWGHVRLFSPWSMLVDGAARALLVATGWQEPDGSGYPTGSEWIEAYLAPLAAALGDGIEVRFGQRVVGVARRGHDLMADAVPGDAGQSGGGRADEPWVVRVEGVEGERRLLARAVLDASGTLGTPSPLGADGMPARGESAARAAGVVSTVIPDVAADPGAWAGLHTVVVGGGHSALTALVGLADVVRSAPATRVTWVLRRPLTAARLGDGAPDEFPRRGALGQAVAHAVGAGLIAVAEQFRVEAVEPDGAGRHRVVAEGGAALDDVDRVIGLTGYRPDLSLAAEVRLDLDPSVQAPRRLAPLIDPNVHSCGSVPPHGEAELRQADAGFYVVGMKAYGRAPTFLARTGYEQVRSVVAALAGDAEAAARVDLLLPETGVCGGSGLAQPLPLVPVGSAGSAGVPADGCC